MSGSACLNPLHGVPYVSVVFIMPGTVTPSDPVLSILNLPLAKSVPPCYHPPHTAMSRKKFTPQFGEALRKELSDAIDAGNTLMSVCRKADVPYYGVYYWITRRRSAKISLDIAERLWFALTGRRMG